MRHLMRPRLLANRPGARGFSLVEIMVAVVVICVGLLGIAKMQAIAVSNTSTARMRAMAAFQAASLASIMHSNRNYWATALAVANNNMTITIPAGTTTLAGVTFAPSGFAPQSTSACITTTAAAGAPVCGLNIANGASLLAGMDVTRWAQNMVGVLPNLITTITCQGALPPPSCTIQMQWTETTGAVNTSETAVPITTEGGVFDYYTLYVAP
jgi:type IV pilus assembly protein PilV